MSENAKHTPGPWVQADFGKHEWEVKVFGIEIGEDGFSGSFNVARAHRPADARLISAAPDLLAALQGLNYYGEIGNGFCCCPRQNWQDDDGLHSTACADARRAIRKAEGKHE